MTMQPSTHRNRSDPAVSHAWYCTVRHSSGIRTDFLKNVTPTFGRVCAPSSSRQNACNKDVLPTPASPTTTTFPSSVTSCCGNVFPLARPLAASCMATAGGYGRQVGSNACGTRGRIKIPRRRKKMKDNKIKIAANAKILRC